MVALLLLAGLLAGWGLSRGLQSAGTAGRTRIDQATVVDRLRDVARLVSTEAMVRDVITYQNTWLGSTKRSLVIATGRVLIGFDLQPPPDIRIAEGEHRISVRLPSARLLGVDILEMKTYDERRGLWNPFHPADRDTIFQLAREQLTATAYDLGVLAHAESSATRLLQSLFAEKGYTVEVRFPRASVAE